MRILAAGDSRGCVALPADAPKRPAIVIESKRRTTRQRQRYHVGGFEAAPTGTPQAPHTRHNLAPPSMLYRVQMCVLTREDFEICRAYRQNFAEPITQKAVNSAQNLADMIKCDKELISLTFVQSPGSPICPAYKFRAPTSSFIGGQIEYAQCGAVGSTNGTWH